ncbi:MAG: hypothetical protein Q7K57_28555, partial [Burkholderiaceae bacterium]|nr:hypothetical protein [Burkholderiaceae bacterium]
LESKKKNLRGLSEFLYLQIIRENQGYKPLSGGIHDQYMQRGPVYRAGFAQCTTLALMPKDRTLSSPNRMVWELFQALRRLCTRLTEAHASQDESALRHDAAICVILAVQCVEVFFNVYFQVLISESAYAHAAGKISADLAKKQFGLDGKIKDWPCHVFGRKLALDKGAGQKFVALKNLRHSLMHFKSSHETFSVTGVAIQGLADASAYESLCAKSAIDALQTAEAFLCEVFTLQGITPENLPHALHSWTGRPPVEA